MIPGMIDYPHEVGRPVYERAVQKMVDKLKPQPGLKSIYQIGSVSTPGVSDIDMVVVFDDDATYSLNPLEGLVDEEPYLFIHNLYGAPASHFEEAQKYSFFHNYLLLWGDDLLKDTPQEDTPDVQLLKTQIALEYLLKMYINVVIQREYNVYKVRSFFLHVKAILYDLEFLGITSGDLFDLTTSLIDTRANWFTAPPGKKELAHNLDAFFKDLVTFLEETVAAHSFYLPAQDHYRLARSIQLRHGSKLGYRREGVLLPSPLRLLGRRYFSLQNRLNTFTFETPTTTDGIPDILTRRFDLVDTMRNYNRDHLPYLMPLTSSLGL